MNKTISLYIPIKNIVIPLSFLHKLNYFLFFQIFEKFFIICVDILINLKVELSRFESQTFYDSDLNIKAI